MAERLGAKFTLDITDLKSGITTANKLIAQNEAAFRADAAEMDDWAKTEEGLKKRIDTLNKNIDLQKSKVSALVAERKRIIEEGQKQGKTDEEIAASVDKLNKKITSEEKSLEKMRSELDKNQKSLDDLNKEQDESAKASEKAAGGFTVAQGALAALAAGGIALALKGLKKLASALVNVGQNADDLNALSKQTGFTTAELQKFEYAADLVDVSVSDITSAVRKLKKNATAESGDVAEAFERIGVSARDDLGELRDINDVFYDVLDGLSKIENETERDTLAMSIFGKGADELAGIIDDGGKALKDYGKEAEDLGLIISQDVLDDANDFNDAIDRIKATGKGVFASMGAEIAKEFAPDVDSLREKIQNFVKNGDFKKLAKDFAEGLKNIFTIGKEVGKVILPPLLNGLKYVAQNAKTLVPLLAKVAAGFVALKVIKSVTSLLTAFTSPLGLTVTLAAGAATALGLFSSSAKETKKSVYELSSETQNAISSFEGLKKASKETIAAEDKQAERLNDLWEELKNITDENGKVKEGYEKRATYILEELNSALDTEYKMNGDIILEYQKMRGEIDLLIKKKRALAYLNALGAGYESSITTTNANKKAFEETAGTYETAKKYYERTREDLESYERDHPGDDGSTWGRLKQTYEDAASQYATASKDRQAAIEAYYKDLLASYVFEAAEAAAAAGDYDAVQKYGSAFYGDLGELQTLLQDRYYSLERAIANETDADRRASLISEREALAGYKDNTYDYNRFLNDVYYTTTGKGAGTFSKPITGTGTGLRATVPVGDSGYSGSLSQAIEQLNAYLAERSKAETIVINQYNEFAKEKSQYEIYESKQNIYAAVRTAMAY